MIEKNLFLKKIEKSYSNFNKAKSIFHLGACTNTLEDNWNYLKHNNLYYSKKLYEFSNYNSIKFIYASSCSIYGTGSDELLNEESSVNPLTPYSKNKLRIEQFLQFKDGGRFKPVILRYATD